MTRSYRYVPPGGGHRAQDHSTLWITDRGIWLARGWVPPRQVLPGPTGGKAGVAMDRHQAAWLLGTWRRRVRREGGEVRREGVR